MPSCLVDQKHGMSTWLDGLGDLCQMQVHCCGVAARQHECRSFAQSRTDGTEDVGRSGALIGCRSRPCATPGPAAGDLVLLPDPRLVSEPQLYRGRLYSLLLRNLRQECGKAFLKCSIAPSAWA